MPNGNHHRPQENLTNLLKILPLFELFVKRDSAHSIPRQLPNTFHTIRTVYSSTRQQMLVIRSISTSRKDCHAGPFLRSISHLRLHKCRCPQVARRLPRRKLRSCYEKSHCSTISPNRRGSAPSPRVRPARESLPRARARIFLHHARRTPRAIFLSPRQSTRAVHRDPRAR